MTIKNVGKENPLLMFVVAALGMLGLSIVLSNVTLYLGKATSAAVGDMVTAVYGFGTIGVGLVTLAAYGGTALIVGIGVTMLLDNTESK